MEKSDVLLVEQGNVVMRMSKDDGVLLVKFGRMDKPEEAAWTLPELLCLQKLGEFILHEGIIATAVVLKPEEEVEPKEVADGGND